MAVFKRMPNCDSTCRAREENEGGKEGRKEGRVKEPGAIIAFIRSMVPMVRLELLGHSWRRPDAAGGISTWAGGKEWGPNTCNFKAMNLEQD